MISDIYYFEVKNFNIINDQKTFIKAKYYNNNNAFLQDYKI